MAIVSSKTFQTENGEAVYLPPEVAFGENTELVIIRSGGVMTLYPVRMSVQEMIARLRELPSPSDIEVRDVIELPEREGL